MFAVSVSANIPGDLNGDGAVKTDDAAATITASSYELNLGVASNISQYKQ